MSKINPPSLSVDSLLAEAGQALLRHYAQALQAPDPDPKKSAVDERDQDNQTPAPLSAKRIKKMRVAARRMRSILRIFEPYFKRKFSKTLLKPLREMATLAGQTRDLYLTIEAAQSYVLLCDDDGKQAMQPMIEDWQTQHNAAQAKLHAYVQSNGFRKWQTHLSATLASDVSNVARVWEVGEPSRLRHVLEAWLWQHLADVRAYDELPERPTPEQVHALRIAIKHLRYLIEALWEVWPVRQRAWLTRLHKQCVAAQDAYGRLNDAHTHEVRVQNFIEDARQRGQRIPLKGIRVYAAEQHRLVEEQIVTWRSYLTPIVKTP